MRRRQWHPTAVLLLEKFHGWRSLEGCSPWGRWGSDTTARYHFHFHALEKEMATHSSVIAWRIPEKGEPGRLPSMGSHRVGHDWSDLAAASFSIWNSSAGISSTPLALFIVMLSKAHLTSHSRMSGSASVQLQQPGNLPEGVSGVSRGWCSLCLKVQDYMFISSFRFPFILWENH